MHGRFGLTGGRWRTRGQRRELALGWAGDPVFEDGRIYGVDVADGKYDGSYEFNDATGLVDVHVRVQMLPNQPSVIGVVQPFEWILDASTAIDPDKESGDVVVQNNLGAPIAARFRFLRSLPAAA